MAVQSSLLARRHALVAPPLGMYSWWLGLLGVFGPALGLFPGSVEVGPSVLWLASCSGDLLWVRLPWMSPTPPTHGYLVLTPLFFAVGLAMDALRSLRLVVGYAREHRDHEARLEARLRAACARQ